MRMSPIKIFTFFFCLLLSHTTLLSKPEFSVFPPKEYPQKQFKSPIRFPISLAGNYGECRPNHFHSGLDIRTQQVEKKPIYTIGAGYVSRIKISHVGFGNALYVSHEGGYTSVYAHLHSYNERISEVVKMLQYYNKKWDIDIYLPFWMLIIPEDDQIALSGNTGSSLAPHLHFEMRNSETENTLNPWLFGFDIDDHTPPNIYAMSVYNLDDDQLFYDQSPQYISNLQGNGSDYRIDKMITVDAEKVGIGLMSRDYMDDRFGKLGVFETQLFVDDELYFAWQLDDISYDDTRYLHAFTDYLMYIRKNKWYHYLFKLPGNKLEIFHDPVRKSGYIDISDGQPHRIKVLQYDAVGNRSSLKFTIKSNAATREKTECKQIRKPKVSNLLRADGMSVRLDADMLYAAMCLDAQKKEANTYRVGQTKYPVFGYYDLIFANPNSQIDNSKYIVERYTEGDTVLGARACYVDGAKLICEGFRDFGIFKLSRDITSPQIKVNLSDGASLKEGSLIKIDANDASTFVSDLQVYANNQWLCMTRRKNTYRYRIDEKCPRGEVKLKITARDENNNTATETLKIKIR